MLYPELFRALGKVRWSPEHDVPWNAFDGTLRSDERAQTIRMNAITEWVALPATQMFLPENRRDSECSAFDGAWEKRVSAMILHNLSSLFGCSFASARELNRYRNSLAPA